MLQSENTLIGPRTPVPLPSGRDAASPDTRAGCPQQSAGRDAAMPESVSRRADNRGGMDAACPPQATLYSFLYSTSRRSSVTLGGTVLATDLAAARHAASAAIIAKHPDGVLKVIEVARNSRFPVKNQDGWIAPGMLDGAIH